MKLVSMISRIDSFQKIVSDRGLKSALTATLHYIKDLHLLENPIRSWLLVGGPPSLPHAAYVKMYQPILEKQIGTGIDVMEKDWDNLILLDSYRADYFRRYSSLEGELSTVVSKGNWSLEFVVKNFQESEYRDTIVITGNQWYQKYSKLDENTFHTLINPVNVAEERTTTDQDPVIEAALEAIERYPNKRVIVHLLKPHEPHKGEKKDQFETAIENEQAPGMMELYRKDIISKEILEQSYIDTIEYIENKIQTLLVELDGKTVVSSDHGENLGEVQHGMMQLAHGNPTPECRFVPWLEMEYDTRRKITEDPPVGFDNVDDQAIEEQLAALGYK